MPSSPFFAIFDDKGNPIYQAISQAAAQGFHFGDSISLDSEGRAYPKGFTPPVDYYRDPNNLQTSNLMFSSQGPVEGGITLIKNGEILGGNLLNKTDGGGLVDPTTTSGFNPGPKINTKNLVDRLSWVQPDNMDPNSGYQVEYGKAIDTSYGVGLNADERIWKDDSDYPERFAVYDFFKDYASKEFTHLLDYFIDQDGSIGGRKPIVMTSVQEGTVVDIQSHNPDEPPKKPWLQGSPGSFFIRTNDDNEDPTILGYDIEIKTLDSPLFNGEIESFITTFGNFNNTEIKSRMETLDLFRQQLLKFVKADSTVKNLITNKELNPVMFDGKTGTKTYYLRNIGGLDKLVESWDSGESGIDKQFVTYGKDFITLSFNEDVSQNLAYLGALYKSLSWSKIRGKQIIPENLLRFDMDITISEIRKYNRVISNGDNLDIISDLVSKYTYRLYECQFFFNKMPQGDSLDLGKNTEAVDSYEIKFNFKFSTMRFTKFLGPTKGDYVIDNKNLDLSMSSMDFPTGATGIGQVKSYSRKLESYLSYSTSSSNQVNVTQGQNNSTRLKAEPISVIFKPKQIIGKSKPWDKLKKDLANAAVREINRQLITQAALLNKTLDNIRNAIPGAGRMSEPTNVYSSSSILQNDVINSLRDFVGGSVKGFFQKP